MTAFDARAPHATPRVFFGGKNGSVKVMSWNCQRFYQYNSGRMAKPEAKIRELGRVIKAEDPDIVCLQEVGDEKLLKEFNQRYLGNAYQSVIVGWSTNSHGPGGAHVAILAKPGFTPVRTERHNRYVFIHERPHEVPNGTRFYYPYHEYVTPSHPMLEVTFEDPNGHLLTVFNAHFKATTPSKKQNPRVQSDTAAARRLEEARIAADLIRKRREENPDEDIILAGDLNTDYDSPSGRPVIQTLAGLPVDGSKPVTAEDIRNGVARNAMVEPFLAQDPNLLPDGAYDTNRLSSHRGKLDYLWVSPGLYGRIQSMAVVGSLKNRTFRKTSDHLPVTMEYAPKPASTGQRLDRTA